MPTAAVRSLDSINRVVQAFCSEGVPYKSVSEIAKICRGQVMSKDFLRDNAGEYPVYSSQTENDGMLGKITTYMFDGEYLTWTTDGANAGTVFYRKGKFSVTNVCGVIDVTDETILTKYLFYVLTLFPASISTTTKWWKLPNGLPPPPEVSWKSPQSTTYICRRASSRLSSWIGMWRGSTPARRRASATWQWPSRPCSRRRAAKSPARRKSPTGADI